MAPYGDYENKKFLMYSFEMEADGEVTLNDFYTFFIILNTAQITLILTLIECEAWEQWMTSETAWFDWTRSHFDNEREGICCYERQRVSWANRATKWA